MKIARSPTVPVSQFKIGTGNYFIKIPPTYHISMLQRHAKESADLTLTLGNASTSFTSPSQAKTSTRRLILTIISRPSLTFVMLQSLHFNVNAPSHVTSLLTVKLHLSSLKLPLLAHLRAVDLTVIQLMKLVNRLSI